MKRSLEDRLRRERGRGAVRTTQLEEREEVRIVVDYRDRGSSRLEVRLPFEPSNLPIHAVVPW